MYASWAKVIVDCEDELIGKTLEQACHCSQEYISGALYKTRRSCLRHGVKCWKKRNKPWIEI